MGSRSSGTSAPPAPSLPPAPPADAQRARITRGRAVLSESTVRREPSERDMRRKRPPALSFLYIALARAGYEWLTGAILRAAGYRRRAVLVGTGRHIRDVAHALSDATHAPIEVVGFLSPKPLPANGLRNLGSLSDLDEVLGSAH